MCRNGYFHLCKTCGVKYGCRDEYPYCYDCFYGPPATYQADVDEKCDQASGHCEGPVDRIPDGFYVTDLCRGHQRVLLEGLYERSELGWPR